MIDQRPQLNIKDVGDQVIRRNFQNLKDYFTSQGQLLDFQFFEVIFSGEETARKITHTLGVIPVDVIVTRITGDGTVDFLLGQFTKDNIYLTASGACRVRFFIGAVNASSTAATGTSDSMSVSASGEGSSSSSSSFDTASATSFLNLFLPIGSTWMIPGLSTAALPVNLMYCEGGAFIPAQYPTLATMMWDTATSKWFNGGTATGPMDAVNTANLPDMRGVVPRGLDGRGAGGLDLDEASRTALNTGGTTGAKAGSYQADAFASHTHAIVTGANFGNSTGNMYSVDAGQPDRNTRATGGTETRGKNVAWRWVIRVK